MLRSHSRVLCVALVGVALVPFQPASGETAEQKKTSVRDEKQLKAIKKALGSRAIKGDKKPNVPLEDRWYVLLLREEHQSRYAETHGNILESGVRARRNVQYRKVRGLDAAAREVLRFLTGPDRSQGPAGTPLFAGRDFAAQYFAAEEDADIYLAANVGAAMAAGAKPSEPRHGVTTK